jgi:acetoin:2,6-dichlorophenolindophenol oxidoreductase subunit alpha
MTTTDVPPDTLRTIFEAMTRAHRVDERLRSMITSGQVFLIYYSPRGQEAVAAALAPLLRTDDYLVTTYRGIHDQIAKGIPLRPLLAEYFGKATGTCKGKGGPMHITHPESGVMVTTGIVGAGLPIANGLALASKLRGTDQVTVATFGDGASNIGAFHEALNLAAVWELPVVFLCQNNQWAEHTSINDSQRNAHVADRAAAYGIPGVTVDGNDPVAMFTAAAAAVARARSGGGPTLLEARTFRLCGHLVGDTMEYLPQEELDAAVAADPVPRFRSWLLDTAGFSEEELAKIESAVDAEIDDAVEFAQASPPPDAEELTTDVYA